MGIFSSLLLNGNGVALPADFARRRWVLAAGACCLGAVWPIDPARAQSEDVKRHVDAAKAAAGDDLLSYLQLADPLQPGYKPPNISLEQRMKLPAPAPGKAFDDLYLLASGWVSAWAIPTSDGIILIDALNNDEEAERLVAGGMKPLGLDPAKVRAVIVTHAHGDHYGGAGYFKREFNSRILMSEPDWSMTETKLEFDSPLWGRPPKRDGIVRDGDAVTLGDRRVDVLLTPGHTLGTITLIFPVRDGPRTHTAMLWGGTAFNFGRNTSRMRAYIDAAERARGIARERGADVLISNHAMYDRAVDKLKAVASGKPNPFVMGTDAVQRALTVMSECAQATLASWTT
jgi:metallo-beta-lactamase class B